MRRNLILVRHGETEWSRATRLTGKSDVPLTAEGEAEAIRCGARLRELLGKAAWGRDGLTVLASPRQRAMSTAKLAALPAQIEEVDLLREADFGDYEGLSRQQILSEAPDWRYWEDGCPNGERLDDLRERGRRLLHSIADRRGAVVMLGHGVLHRARLCVMLELPISMGERFVLDTGAWLQVDEDEFGFRRLHCTA